jgi:hypothetical protein
MKGKLKYLFGISAILIILFYSSKWFFTIQPDLIEKKPILVSFLLVNHLVFFIFFLSNKHPVSDLGDETIKHPEKLKEIINVCSSLIKKEEDIIPDTIDIGTALKIIDIIDIDQDGEALKRKEKVKEIINVCSSLIQKKEEDSVPDKIDMDIAIKIIDTIYTDQGGKALKPQEKVKGVIDVCSKTIFKAVPILSRTLSSTFFIGDESDDDTLYTENSPLNVREMMTDLEFNVVVASYIQNQNSLWNQEKTLRGTNQILFQVVQSIHNIKKQL